jgi:hypothetical protein
MALVENDNGVGEERARLTSSRDRMAFLAARIAEAQKSADEAHAEAEEALRLFEERQ